MKRIILFLFLLCFSPLFSDSLLKERLLRSQPGSYAVFEQGKTRSLLHVHSRKDQVLILEEISLPSSLNVSSWQDWMEERAPGHTSWSMYAIDLEKGELLSCFSFSRASWIQMGSQDHFLTLLLKKSFHTLPDVRRKKIGAPPMDGETDMRPLWNPPFLHEGKKIPVEYTVSEIEWPKDASELSEKRLEVYFDKKNLSPFPAWIQVHNNHASVFARMVGSGEGLHSYYTSFPSH